MNNTNLNISEELLQNLSIEEIADLKIEVDDLMIKINNVLENCESALNS